MHAVYAYPKGVVCIDGMLYLFVLSNLKEVMSKSIGHTHHTRGWGTWSFAGEESWRLSGIASPARVTGNERRYLEFPKPTSRSSPRHLSGPLKEIATS